MHRQAGILLIFVVVSTLCANLPVSNYSTANERAITLEELMSGYYDRESISASWISGSTMELVQNNIIKIYNVETETETDILDKRIIQDLLGESKLSSIKFSKDRTWVAAVHDKRNLWRHSFLAKYDFYEINGDESKLLPLIPGEENDRNNIQLFEWSPSSLQFAYVYKNNLYYNRGPRLSSILLTSDGSSNFYNGHADWVYEEELLGTNKAFWFSNDGSHLAFMTFDAKNVQNFEFPFFGDPKQVESYGYTEEIVTPYPKAGTSNSKVALKFVDLTKPILRVKVMTFEVPEEVELIASVTWTPSNSLVVLTMNRIQNKAAFHLCDVTTNLCTKSFELEEEEGWISTQNPKISEDGNFMLITTYVSTSTEPGAQRYKQLLKITLSDGSVEELTTNNFDIISVIGWLGLEEDYTEYFLATGLDDEGNNVPSEQHLYRLTGPDLSCLTCDLRNTFDEPCLWNTVTFSSNYKFFNHYCNGPGIPQVVTRSSDDLSVKRLWVENTELREKLEKKDSPEIIKNLKAPITEQFSADVRLFLPKNLDETKKYPLLINVYAGPGSSQISESFSITWDTTLVSDKEYIIAQIDGRGAGRRSAEVLFSVYKNLGTLEVQDQITAAKWIVEKYNFIDQNQVAIWGWSYGGYATTRALELDDLDLFKCGISVAPVTSWYFYDTIYTERYMSTPQLNPENYKGTDVFSNEEHLEQLRSKMLMLVHGTADDNVHYQHSMFLSRALQEKDINFEQMTYADAGHGIYRSGIRRHLYHTLERFLDTNCFEEKLDNGVPTTPKPPVTTDSSSSTLDSSSPLFYPSSSLLFISLTFLLAGRI